MKPTTPTLYWGPVLQTGCVIVMAIVIAIDIDVHAIENHFQNLARTFVTPLYPVTKVSCQILIKYFMMFASIMWLWVSIRFGWTPFGFILDCALLL